MALTWKLETAPELSDEASKALETVIFTTIAVGMNRITEENYMEFYSRYRQYWMAGGRSGADFNLAQLKEMIGLTTNASTLTPAAWRKRVAEILGQRGDFIAKAESQGTRPAQVDWTDEHRARVAIAERFGLTDEYAQRIMNVVSGELSGRAVPQTEEEA